MTLYKEYKKLESGQDIKFNISFNRETRNWATSQPMKIGYRVSAVPISIQDKGNGITIESFSAFTGFTDSLLEVDRQSKKRLEKAVEILHERMGKYLDHFKEIENEKEIN